MNVSNMPITPVKESPSFKIKLSVARFHALSLNIQRARLRRVRTAILPASPALINPTNTVLHATLGIIYPKNQPSMVSVLRKGYYLALMN